MYSLARNRKLERKLASIVTDVCDECLGNGSLQFCGGETCPSCNGTGKPPKEVKVYKCINCGAESLESDTTNFTMCSPWSSNKHEFVLNAVYTNETK
jgi:DnaJ-class molecular chaperone